LLNIDALLSDRELEVRGDVRSFGEDEIKPSISEWWEEARFPKEIVPKMARGACSGCISKATAAPGRAPSSTASLAWNSKPETRG
jgi:glutaryl-CoA dehydrogenase